MDEGDLLNNGNGLEEGDMDAEGELLSCVYHNVRVGKLSTTKNCIVDTECHVTDFLFNTYAVKHCA